MKEIKVWFCDQCPTWNNEDNFIMNILKKKYKVILDSKNPEFLFFSVYGYTYTKYNCIRILYIGENVFPDFNICDYAIGYHDIKLEERYLRYPFYIRVLKELEGRKKKYKKEYLAEKTRFCNFIYSNPNANKIRTDFFVELNKYKKVDSAGKYMNNIGYAVEDAYEFQKKCKFTIAFENEGYPDYCTEKLINAFKANTIPIYWGDKNITKEINPNSFIQCKSQEDFSRVIKKIIELDNNDELYLKMLNEDILINKDIVNEKEEELKKFIEKIIETGNIKRRPQSLEAKRREKIIKRGSVLINIKHKIHRIKSIIKHTIKNKKKRK